MLNKEEIEDIKKGIIEGLDRTITECRMDYIRKKKEKVIKNRIKQLENKIKELLIKYKKEYYKINNMQTNSVNASVLQELKCIIEDLESIAEGEN